MFYELDRSIANTFSVFTYVIMTPIWIFIIIFACRQMWKLYKRRKSNGQKSWYFILLYSTITFVLVTGNWLPNKVYYEYLCYQLSEDNLRIYKTPEEWIKENQDLLSGEPVKFKINSKDDLPEKFKRRLNFRSKNGYFTEITIYNSIFSRLTKRQKIILDNRTGNILMSKDSILKSIRFHSPPMVGTVGCEYDYSKSSSIIEGFSSIKEGVSNLGNKL